MKDNLIGRDNLIEKEIEPRLNHPTNRFILVGEPGIGKTALLEYCLTHTEGKSALITANKPKTINLHSIAKQWEIEPGGKKISDYEAAILGCEGNTIYIDDLHAASARTLQEYMIFAERHKVCGSMRPVPKLKDDLKQFLYSVKQITLPRLNKVDAELLARKACLEEKSKISHKEIAKAAYGLPGRIVAFAKAGEIQHNVARIYTDEIDISPILLIIGAIPVVFRVLGRATDATDLTVVGGLSMLFLLLMRMLLQQGKRGRE